jgi:hypothetical protein
MRLKSLIAMAAAVLALGLAAPKPAEAFGWHRNGEPAGWGRMRTIRHWVYYPRYHHTYHSHVATDPYAYRYEPRGYYPYYNSHYWRPAQEMKVARPHYKRPTYHKAWGAKKKHYNHVQWHIEKHGGHRRHHW